MRIGLNLLHALPEIGGGWNYIARLVEALGNHDHDNQFVAFVTTASACLVPNQRNFTPVPVRIQAASRFQRIAYENTLLQKLAGNYQLDCMHWFANAHGVVNRVPSVVTVYDLQPFRELAQLSLLKRTFLRWMLKNTVKHSPMLLPMSQSTADDLERELSADPRRITVVPPVLPDRFRPMKSDLVSEFRKKFQLPPEFWLYVAHFYPHKNHIRLFQSYHRLKEIGANPWPLVLRGDDHGSFSEVKAAIAQLGLNDDIILLPPLDELEIPVLYATASALIFPSLYEGGGMPVIEAMACGCPVVASSIPPVKEFAGEVALYFDQTDSASIASFMAAFQQNTEWQVKHRGAGLDRADLFRAERVVAVLVEAYSMVLTDAATRQRKKVI